MEGNARQIKDGIMINLNVSVKNMYLKRIIFGILLHVVVKMVIIDDDSVIICYEIIEETKTIPTNFNAKNATHKTQNFIFYLRFCYVLLYY